MKIGFVDCDLLDNGTRFPNLALMKLAGYYKRLGNEVELLETWGDVEKIFCSKVFSKTKEPLFLNLYPKDIEIIKGGTGYCLQNAEPLPYEIEHSLPFYDLYENYWGKREKAKNWRKIAPEYFDCSIGFTTRGCIRRCPFCVNKNKTKVEYWSPVEEFLDKTRKNICLLDDNILAFPKWEEIFESLIATGKPFYYKQGMDIRLMTKEKATVLESSKYKGEMTFAFDNIADKDLIKKRFEVFREYCSKPSKAYVLVGFYNTGLQEVLDLIERIEILKSFGVLPYVMKHENYKKNEYAPIITELARFCNQPAFLKKMTFYDFCKIPNNGSKASRKMIDEIKDNRILNISYKF